MKKNSIIDCCGYLLFSLFGIIIRIFPAGVSFFIGKKLGELFYCFGLKHKSLVYSNIKSAFGDNLSPAQLNNLAKKFYRNFGQNFIEIFRLPLMDKKYYDKFITVEGKEYLSAGFKKGKGVILLAVHEGNWELSNLISRNLGIPFNLFIRQQRLPLLNKLLNSYRTHRGYNLIHRQEAVSGGVTRINQIADEQDESYGLRRLIEVLKKNEAIGMMADQGGRSGTLVDFLGRQASMSSGAVKLALKYQASIIPVFYTRIKGAYHKVIFEPPVNLQITGDRDTDIRQNLQMIIAVFEKYIRKYPQEYLWTYKIWKYSKEKMILVISDGKAGHLRQTQAVVRSISNQLKEKENTVGINTIEVVFKSHIARKALILSCCLAGKYRCQGCLWCLKAFLTKDTYKSLISMKPDIIISAGSALAPVNFLLSRESLAKSVVMMRPSFLSTRRFNLVIIPRHDRPPKRKNIVITEGALNLVDENYLKEQRSELQRLLGNDQKEVEFYIGVLIGGDTKKFSLKKSIISQVIKEVKNAAEEFNAGILLTTSRRTSREIEDFLKNEFLNYPRCKFLLIANERNLSFAVGGILGMSQMVIVSPESISMISEAVKSKKHILVFSAGGLSKKHRFFLENFSANKYISLVTPTELKEIIAGIRRDKPAVCAPEDELVLDNAVKKIL